jgi:hypothetical protein
MPTSPPRQKLLRDLVANVGVLLDASAALRGLAQRRGDIGMDPAGDTPLDVDDLAGDLGHLSVADIQAAAAALGAMQAWFDAHPEYRVALNKVRS